MAYFFYTRTAAAPSWGACKTTHEPALKTTEGRKVKIHGLVKLPQEHETLSLSALSKLYPMDPPHD